MAFGTAVDFIAGKLQYRIVAEDDSKTGTDSAIRNLTNLNTSANRLLTQFRRQYRDGLLTLDQYGNLVASTMNGVATTAPAALNKVTAASNKAGSSLMGLGNIMNSVWYGLVAGVVTGAVFSFINLFENLLNSFTNFVVGFISQSSILSGQMEQLRIGFEALTGSADTARGLYDWLWQFSIKSPFKFEDIAPAVRQMMNYGFTLKEVQDRLLPMLGEIASGAGLTSEQFGNMLYAFGQIETYGKLRAQEANQLINSGIPIYALLREKFGLNQQDLTDKMAEGGITSSMVYDVVEEFSKKYTGAMDRMNKTFVGQINQFQETIQYAMISFGDVFTTVFLPVLTLVNDKLVDWLPTLEKWSKLLVGVSDSLQKFWGKITGLKDDEGVLKFFKDLLAVAAPIATAIGVLIPPIGALELALATLSLWLTAVFKSDYWQAIYNFGQAFMLVLDAVGNAFSNFFNRLGSFDDLINKYLKIMVFVSEVTLTLATILTDNSKSLGERLGDIFKWMMTNILDILQQGFVAALAAIHIFGLNVLKAIQEGINNAIDFLNAGHENIFNGFIKFLSLLNALSHPLATIGRYLGAALANGLAEKVETGLNNLVTSINNWINAHPMLKKFGISALQSLALGRVVTPEVDLSNINFSDLYKTQHVDLMGTIGSSWTNYMYDLVESVNTTINDLQKQYGLNITLGDLEKKYGVDKTSFQDILNKIKQLLAGSGTSEEDNPLETPLEDLKKTIKDLGDKIDGKKWTFNLYFDVKVANAGNQAEVEAVGDTLQNAVTKAINQRGITAG